MGAATSYMRPESIALDLAHAALAPHGLTHLGASRLATLVHMFDEAALAPGSDITALRPVIALSLLAREHLSARNDDAVPALIATAVLVQAKFSP